MQEQARIFLNSHAVHLQSLIYNHSFIIIHLQSFIYNIGKLKTYIIKLYDHKAIEP